MPTLAQRRVIPSEMREYFRDVATTWPASCEQVESFDELLQLHPAGGARPLDALANEDMRKISSWVAIIAVPTMIAGIYGMNFEHMPELDCRLRLPDGASA